MKKKKFEKKQRLQVIWLTVVFLRVDKWDSPETEFTKIQKTKHLLKSHTIHMIPEMARYNSSFQI